MAVAHPALPYCNYITVRIADYDDAKKKINLSYYELERRLQKESKQAP